MIEYCQHCDYNPSTGTHSGCGEDFQCGPPAPGNGRLSPGDLKNVPTLEQDPTTPPSLSEGGNNVEVPLTETIEQTPQTDDSMDGQGNEDNQPPPLKSKENPPLNNEFTEQS